jgi:hypothetical protein
MLGAGFLAFIVVLPAPSQAHLTGLQLEVSRLCNTKLSERVSRTEGTCKGQTLAKVVLPEPLPISGKVAAALAGDLYCGLSSTGVSELTRAADIPLCRTPRKSARPRPPPTALWNGRAGDSTHRPIRG